MNPRFDWLRSPRLLLLSSLISVAFLSGAFYLQFVENEAPCPLCILQRYAHLFIGLFALIGAIVRHRRLNLALHMLTLLATVGGIAAAARHIWLLKHPFFSCGFDVLRPIVDNLPLAWILPSAFTVSRLCEVPYVPILGLSLSSWSLIGYLSILVLISISFFLSYRLGSAAKSSL